MYGFFLTKKIHTFHFKVQLSLIHCNEMEFKETIKLERRVFLSMAGFGVLQILSN